MHIPPFENKNKPIVDIEDSRVPLNYFNIVKLNKDQSFEYQTPGYETCIVPATGTINVEIEGIKVESLGTRTVDVWDGEPEGVYVPSNTKAQFTSLVDNSEIFIAGAKYDKTLEPFAVRTNEIDLVQYGSDDTKTHRKIKHILGAKHHDKVGRLLCNELYTFFPQAPRARERTSNISRLTRLAPEGLRGTVFRIQWDLAGEQISAALKNSN